MTSLILQTGTRALFHTIVLFGVFLLFAGHNAPGGGFIGGLVVGAAIVLRYVAEDAEAIRRTIRIRPERLLGTGILLAVATGLAGFAIDGAFLASGALKLSALPLLGDVKAISVLVFDIGVFCIVVGLVLTVTETLGAEMTG